MSRKTLVTAAAALALLGVAACSQNGALNSSSAIPANGMSQNPGSEGQYGTAPSPNNPTGKAPSGGSD